MNFPSHLTFGIFTALLAYYVTNDWIAAAILLLVQIGLILDFVMKKLFHFEPFHTVLAMLAAWALSVLLFPAFHWYVIIAYFTHLFLDIWVHEEIPLLWPFKKQLMYPIKHSERYVIIASTIGALVMAAVIIA